jgi:ATP-dependent Lon protease
MPITVGREKSMKLVNDVDQAGGVLGAVLQRRHSLDDPEPKDLHSVGTAARILKILEMPNGNYTVILHGIEKIEIMEYINTDPYLKASVLPVRDSTPPQDHSEYVALVDSIRDIALEIIGRSPGMPKEAAFAIKSIDSRRGIINFICTNFDLKDNDRQKLLEAPGLLARARKLLEILLDEQQFVDLKKNIQGKVRQEMDKQQRDYYLRQQISTMQQELGESSTDEIEKMRERAKSKKWSKPLAELFEKEAARLDRLHPMGSEFSIQTTYLNLLLDLPWEETSEDNLDLARARAQLDKDHFGLDEVKDRILEHLAVIKLKGDLKSPSCVSTAPRGWVKPRSDAASPTLWGANSGAYHWADYTTKPKSADTAEPTSEQCPDA